LAPVDRTQEELGMKIISLTAENIKKLSAVEIRPDGALVQITGRNGQGKTSVLDAIWWALAGASHIQSTPIRKGADRARIRLDLGEIIVTRTFGKKKTEDGSEGELTTTITVENADGARFPSPQKMLDSLLGALSFDPLAFSRMEAREQLEMLKQFVPSVDFAAIEKANAEDYGKRTDLNRQAKTLRAQADRMIVGEDVPDQPIDEAALIVQLEEAGQTNASIEQRKGARANAAQKIEANRSAAASARTDAKKLLDQAEALDREAEDLAAKLANAGALPEPIDTSGLRQKIEAARETNRLVSLKTERKKCEAEIARLQAESLALTDAMEKREKVKRDAIASAELPVAGIGFGDGCILLNGLPFDQASDAEQLRASVAIAMAANPKLRVIRVRDGSLLDEDALRLVGEMAEERDYQVWVERVDSSGTIGFVLEDGTLKSAHIADAAE
jgi:hypothetical protein